MSLTRISVLAVAGIAMIGVSAASFADDMSDPVSARIELMKANGRALRAAFSASGDEAVSLAQELVDDFAKVGDLFPEGSTSPNSHALPNIWTDPAGFSDALAKAQEAASALLVAARAGDATAYSAAAKAMGGACKNCHDTYRAPIN